MCGGEDASGAPLKKLFISFIKLLLPEAALFVLSICTGGCMPK
jgi:hypothetical protein